jgi:hypothetical protein
MSREIPRPSPTLTSSLKLWRASQCSICGRGHGLERWWQVTQALLTAFRPRLVLKLTTIVDVDQSSSERKGRQKVVNYGRIL